MKIQQIILLGFLYLMGNPAFSKDAPYVGVDLKGLPCKGTKTATGPFDYMDPVAKYAKVGGGKDSMLELVEMGHFSSDTENLIKPMGSGFLGDFQYTLQVFPNHHKALLSFIRFQLEVDNKLRKPEKITFNSLECYFQRAINFSPKDAAVYSLYGYYLGKIGEMQKAQEQYEKALEIAPDSSKIEYAYSLLLIELKQYDKALEYAQKAYRHGKPPLGLQNKLKKIGVWK